MNSADVLKDRLAKAERELKSAQKDNTHRYEQLQDLHGRLKNTENANANLLKENQVGIGFVVARLQTPDCNGFFL